MCRRWVIHACLLARSIVDSRFCVCVYACARACHHPPPAALSHWVLLFRLASCMRCIAVPSKHIYQAHLLA